VADLADYLDLRVGEARKQFRAVRLRRPLRGGVEGAWSELGTERILLAVAWVGQ
jgi:hypothetical protein